jgi:nucleoside-diphosphate-sugar epimerase
VTSVRSQDEERLFEVNVAGTGLVMEACVRADVERVVYTSSAAVVGPAARGETADEGQLFTAGRLGIPNVASVHEASSRRCAWRHAACSSCA